MACVCGKTQEETADTLRRAEELLQRLLPWQDRRPPADEIAPALESLNVFKRALLDICDPSAPNPAPAGATDVLDRVFMAIARIVPMQFDAEHEEAVEAEPVPVQAVTPRSSAVLLQVQPTPTLEQVLSPSPRRGEAGDGGKWGLERPEVRWRDVELAEELGRGAYGRVYRANVCGTAMAAKVLDGVPDWEALRSEVAMLRRARHPHVVACHGVCTDPDHPAIFTELLTRDLAALVHGPQSASLCDFQKLKIALDAARAMSWLHDKCKVAHSDLKLSNLLLDDKDTVKIADYGTSLLARDLVQADPRDRLASSQYAAPEVLSGGSVNLAIDVYSFGIVLWELMTGEVPFGNYKTADDIREAVLKRDERPDLGALNVQSQTLPVLIRGCWERDPLKRPSFAGVVKTLGICVVETCLQDEAADFWKENFLEPELSVKVPWDTFAEVMARAFKMEKPLDLRSAFDRTTTTFPAGTVTKNKPCDWYGLAGLFCDFSDPDKPGVTMQKLRDFQNFFGGFNGIILHHVHSLASQPWFHSCVSKEEADSRLARRPLKTFLVRTSTTVAGAPFVLSIVSNGCIDAWRISKSSRLLPDGKPAYCCTLIDSGTNMPAEARGVSLKQIIEKLQQKGIVAQPCPRFVLPSAFSEFPDSK